MTQADHERPGMQISLAMIWLMSRPSNPDALATDIVLRVGSPPRSQPIPITSGTAQISRSGKLASLSVKPLGCSGALSHRKKCMVE